MAGKDKARDTADNAPKAKEAQAGKVHRTASGEAESNVVVDAAGVGLAPSQHLTRAVDGGPSPSREDDERPSTHSK